jgi:hypothetical protein
MKQTAPLSFHLNVLLFSPLAPLHTADFSLIAKDNAPPK